MEVKKRGGARVGAGRKPNEVKRKAVGLRLDEPTINKLKQKAKINGTTFSKYLEDIILANI